MKCECFNETPEFDDFDKSTCVGCGKIFDNKIYLNNQMIFDKNIHIPKNPKNNQKEQLNAYILNIQKKNNYLTEQFIISDIHYLYKLSTETYKTINNYKKIKNNDVFCYLSCWYVFKNYNKLDILNYLEKIKPKNLNKFNKIFYLISQSENFIKDYSINHNIHKKSILFDDYSWIIYDILYKEDKTEEYDKIYNLCIKMFELDKFISIQNLKKYILKIIK
jgi:hypothetical protein